MANPSSCSPIHRLRCRLIVYLYFSVFLISGFSYPLKHFEWAVWPWKNTWFMFYQTAELMPKIEVTGELEDGRRTSLDLKRWFNYPVAYETYRYDDVVFSEISAYYLAQYVCEQYNDAAIPGQRVKNLTVWDSSWNMWSEKTRKRTRFDHAKETGEVTTRKMVLFPCGIEDQVL